MYDDIGLKILQLLDEEKPNITDIDNHIFLMNKKIDLVIQKDNIIRVNNQEIKISRKTSRKIIKKVNELIKETLKANSENKINDIKKMLGL